MVLFYLQTRINYLVEEWEIPRLLYALNVVKSLFTLRM